MPLSPALPGQGHYLSQVAFSVTDLGRSVAFYREAFGLQDSGGTAAFRGPGASYVQGVEGIASRTHWLQDDRAGLQLEFFEFEHPPRVLPPADRRASDIGMTRVAFFVADLDACLARASAGGGRVLAADLVGGRRRALLADPDGVWLEVTEEPRQVAAGFGARVAGVALSVQDLAAAQRLYADGIGWAARAHADDGVDALLGLTGARRQAVRLDAGTAWIELSQYERPAPRPWRDGHLLTDIGLSHLAVSAPDARAYDRLFARLCDGGWLRPHQPKPLALGTLFKVMYGRDAGGFTLEVLHVSAAARGLLGFRPPRAADRLLMAVLDTGAAWLFGAPRRRP